MRRLFENHIFFKSLTTIIKNFDKLFVNIMQNYLKIKFSIAP